MIKLPGKKLPAELQACFDLDQPAGLRLGAALAGTTLSQALVDDLLDPNWAILQETCYGTIYLCGEIDAMTLAQAVERLRAERDVGLGLWPESELERRLAPVLAPTVDYDGQVSDFTHRVPPAFTDRYLQVPQKCHLETLSAGFIQAHLDPEWFLGTYGSIEHALENGFGLALMDGDEVLCQAFAGPEYNGLIEVGTETAASHRGQGYATVTCAHLIRECEARGYQTYWNCNQQNQPSIALARKLGYQNERPYRLLYWSQKMS